MSTIARLPCRSAAVFAGVLAFPSVVVADPPAEREIAPQVAPAPALQQESGQASPAGAEDPVLDPGGLARPIVTTGDDDHDDGKRDGVTPDAACLARTLCAVKDKIRWQTPAWSPDHCRTIADAVLRSSKKHDLSPTLLLAVMINESDMTEHVARESVRDGRVYAKDSGLMAIRCVLDKHDRCLNGPVRGMNWKQVMDPATNIELGAQELASWRDGGAVERKVVKVRDASGALRPVYKNVPCRHRDHAWWAHYNHGPRYISTGSPRHYPHRVAVIDHALASVLNVEAPELHAGRITIRDPGRRERTVDRPMEPRYKKLCSQIQSVASCGPVALN